jgi:hypothetical protein
LTVVLAVSGLQSAHTITDLVEYLTSGNVKTAR